MIDLSITLLAKQGTDIPDVLLLSSFLYAQKKLLRDH
jgi:hypothetical protein